tara:strand:+ start:224 stop:604 length:381 start_codon:yes stop_codon:yes gene_type:complete
MIGIGNYTDLLELICIINPKSMIFLSKLSYKMSKKILLKNTVTIQSYYKRYKVPKQLPNLYNKNLFIRFLLINNTDIQLNSILATIHNQSKIELNDKSIKKQLLNLSNADILEITLLCKLLKNSSF